MSSRSERRKSNRRWSGFVNRWGRQPRERLADVRGEDYLLSMNGRASDAAGKQVYRPSRLLAVTMAGAGLLWVAVLGYLLTFDGVPLKTWLSTAFFILFFAVSLTYYWRTRIVVDARGITYRGMVRTRHFSFDDIRKVDVLPGPVTVYAIRGRAGLVHFTSFFQHHQHLARLLVERAGLAPLRGF